MNSTMNRRDFVKSLAAASALSLTGMGKWAHAASDLPIGIQLYTVRDLSGKDFEGTLRKVADMGYPAFEFAGYGGMSAAQVTNLVNELGVKVAGTHEGYNNFIKDTEQVIEFNQMIGNKYVVVPSMPGFVRSGDKREIERFANKLNVFGYSVKKAGMQLCYHNHSFEFDKIGDQTIFDILFTATDAELVKAEVDIAWVYNADVDPVELLDRYGDRIKLLHMKDLDKNRKLTPVGTGVIPLKKVVKKAREIGVEWYIVEQDRTERPVLEAIEISLNNMKKLLS